MSTTIYSNSANFCNSLVNQQKMCHRMSRMNTSKSKLTLNIPPDDKRRSTVRFTREDLRKIASLEAASGETTLSGILRWCVDRAVKSLRKRA